MAEYSTKVFYKNTDLSAKDSESIFKQRFMDLSNIGMQSQIVRSELEYYPQEIFLFIRSYSYGYEQYKPYIYSFEKTAAVLKTIAITLLLGSLFLLGLFAR